MTFLAAAGVGYGVATTVKMEDMPQLDPFVALQHVLLALGLLHLWHGSPFCSPHRAVHFAGCWHVQKKFSPGPAICKFALDKMACLAFAIACTLPNLPCVRPFAWARCFEPRSESIDFCEGLTWALRQAGKLQIREHSLGTSFVFFVRLVRFAFRGKRGRFCVFRSGSGLPQLRGPRRSFRGLRQLLQPHAPRSFQFFVAGWWACIASDWETLVVLHLFSHWKCSVAFG